MAERSRTQRRTALVVLGWVGAAALATGVTLAAVSSIGTGIFGSSPGPFDQQEIAQALSALPSDADPSRTASATPEATSTTGTEPVPEPVGKPTVITSPGGTVVARCSDNRVELLSWSPAQGFRVDQAKHGPAREVEVEFESGEDEVEMKVRCVDGVPDENVEADD